MLCNQKQMVASTEGLVGGGHRALIKGTVPFALPLLHILFYVDSTVSILHIEPIKEHFRKWLNLVLCWKEWLKTSAYCGVVILLRTLNFVWGEIGGVLLFIRWGYSWRTWSPFCNPTPIILTRHARTLKINSDYEDLRMYLKVIGD